MLKPPSCLLLLLIVVAPTSALLAAPNYDDHIKPIFEQSCNNCHNPDKAKGDLDLSTYSASLRGGSGGKIAEPGEGASSKLYGVITHTLKPKMPEKADKIDKKEADLIRAWIDGGMLENKTGKPKKKSKPTFTLSAEPTVGKPDGPPPMPQHLLLEPVVKTSRATSVNDMATSPWAPLLAIAAQYQVLLYNTETLELAAVLPFEYGQPEVLSFHPSGKYLLAGGGIAGKSGTTVTWEIETGKTVLRAGKDFDSVLAASLRSDLGGVSLGGPGKRVKLWDTSTDEPLISIKKHTDWVTQLAYSPDGVLLASGGRGGGVYVWEGETGNEFHNLRAHQASISGLSWRSDSNVLATASEDGNVIIWEMNHGKQVKKIPAHTGGVLAIDWTRTGELVTSGRDKKVKLWKPDFNLLKELPVFPNLIVEVSFSHDGKRLFCADWAGVISVWDVATAKKIGGISANPPSIADQIISIQKETAELTHKTVEIEKAANDAEAHWLAAKSTLAKEDADYQRLQTEKKKLTKDRANLDTKLDQIHQQLGTQKTRLKRWQAGAVNADALRLEKEAITLIAQQYEAMDAFTALAAEIQQLKDPAKLKEKSRTLAEHRKIIDQSAPGVLAKSREASAKKSAYQKALAH